MLGSTPIASDLGLGPEICFLNIISGDVDAAGPGSPLLSHFISPVPGDFGATIQKLKLMKQPAQVIAAE